MNALTKAIVIGYAMNALGYADAQVRGMSVIGITRGGCEFRIGDFFQIFANARKAA